VGALAAPRFLSIVSRAVKTIRQCELITPGDRILAAISGGKDSLALLDVLVHLRDRPDFDFHLEVIHVRPVDVCRDCGQCAALAERVAALEIPWHLRETRLDQPVVDCHRCSRARRRAIWETAVEREIHTVALGHHRDDLADTALINLLAHGEASTMKHKQELFGGEIEVIRPLADVRECRLAEHVAQRGYRVADCRCPADGTSVRARSHALLEAAGRDFPRARQNLVRAVIRAMEPKG